MTSLPALLLAAVLAGLASAAATANFRRWALHRKVLDIPNARSSHDAPTPRGGGIGIVTGFLVGLAVWVAAGGSLSPRALGWLVGALLVAGISFLDDLNDVPARIRLGIHLLAAVLLTVAGVQSGEDLPLLVTLPLAFLWVVTVTNIYNFMDGVDALAALQAIVAGIAYAFAGLIVGNPLVAVAGALVATSTAGFLPFNLPPARLFMGDVGSTFLGFTFAALPLLANLGVGGNRLPIEFGAIVLAPFLFDSLVTLTRRILRGERWYEAHRSHYYQRLVQTGFSHGQVSARYAALAVFAAVAAVAGLYLAWPYRALLGLAAFLLMLGIVALVWRLERQTARVVTS